MVQIPVLESQELRMEREQFARIYTVVVEPGLKTRIQNSRAQRFNKGYSLYTPSRQNS